MDIFISYSWKDIEIATAIESGLRAARFAVWRDAYGTRAGQVLGTQVEQALRDARCVLACLSPASIRSDWVRAEMRHAKGKLLPVMIEPFERTVDVDADLGGLLYRDLTPWVRHQSHVPWESLVVDCRAMLGMSAVAGTAAPAPPAPPKPQSPSSADKPQTVSVSIHNTGTVENVIGHVQGNVTFNKGSKIP